MSFEYWLQIILTVVPIIAIIGWRMGVLGEKVSQIEKRLGDNGDSVPSRCREHTSTLKDLARRIGILEET